MGCRLQGATPDLRPDVSRSFVTAARPAGLKRCHGVPAGSTWTDRIRLPFLHSLPLDLYIRGFRQCFRTF